MGSKQILHCLPSFPQGKQGWDYPAAAKKKPSKERTGLMHSLREAKRIMHLFFRRADTISQKKDFGVAGKNKGKK